MRDLTNQCFGRLTAVELVRKEKKKGYIWKCKCSCGGMKEVPAIYLVNGHTKSCGCIKLENKRKQDITGERFDRLEAVCPTDERDESGSVVWKCVCQCGNTKSNGTDISHNCYETNIPHSFSAQGITL